MKQDPREGKKKKKKGEGDLSYGGENYGVSDADLLRFGGDEGDEPTEVFFLFFLGLWWPGVHKRSEAAGDDGDD